MFKVWTETHPDNVSSHKNLYDAYCAMLELVEDGFEPFCKLDNNDKIMSYSEVHNSLHN